MKPFTKTSLILAAFFAAALVGGCPRPDALPGLVWLSDPLTVEEHLKLGAIYEREGNDDRAVREYAAALRKDPASLVAITGLGNVSAHQGKFKLAVKYYQQALALDPENTVVTNNLALAYLELGDISRAAQTADRAVELDLRDNDQDPRVLDTRARARLAAGDADGALADLTRAAQRCEEISADADLTETCDEIKARYYQMTGER